MNLILVAALFAGCLCAFAWLNLQVGRTMHEGALRTASGKGEVTLLGDVLLRPVHRQDGTCILRAGTRIRGIVDGLDKMVRVSVVDDAHRDGAGGCGQVVGDIQFDDLHRYSDATNEVAPDGTVRHRSAN